MTIKDDTNDIDDIRRRAGIDEELCEAGHGNSDTLLRALLVDIEKAANRASSGETENVLRSLFNKYRDERSKKYIKW